MIKKHHFLTLFWTIGILAGVLMLTGCGFTPVYSNKTASNNEAVRDVMANTYVDIIPERTGVSLRNQLIDRFYTHGTPNDPDYILKVASVQRASSDLDLTESADTTRVQIRLRTQMMLVDANTNKVVTQQQVTSITSYNVLASEFATRVSKQAAEESAITDLAQQIETRVSLFLAAQ